MARWLPVPRAASSSVWWTVFLAGAAAGLAAPLVQRVPGVGGEDHSWTMAYGIAASALLVVALVYTARRRMPRRGPAPSYHWLQAHVYGGALFLLLLAVHSGLAAPAGPLSWGLWAVSVWVVGTGLAGVLLQKWIPPALTSGLSTEVHYDRIPELVAAVRTQAEEVATAGGESVRRFHEASLAPALAGPRTSLVYFFDITGGIQSHLRRFDRQQRLLEGDDRRRLDTLRTLVRAKLEMDAHYTLQGALRWWLYLHVPPVFVLVALVAAHVLAVLYY